MTLLKRTSFTKLAAIAAISAITFLPDFAHAGAGGGALFNSGTNFLNSLETLLTATWARIIAIIAVVFVGFAWMLGRLQWGMAASVIGGVILVFGSAAIVDSISGSI